MASANPACAYRCACPHCCRIYVSSHDCVKTAPWTPPNISRSTATCHIKLKLVHTIGPRPFLNTSGACQSGTEDLVPRETCARPNKHCLGNPFRQKVRMYTRMYTVALLMSSAFVTVHTMQEIQPESKGIPCSFRTSSFKFCCYLRICKLRADARRYINAKPLSSHDSHLVRQMTISMHHKGRVRPHPAR